MVSSEDDCQRKGFRLRNLSDMFHLLHHWTDNYYIASCYFSELITCDVMQLFTSIMVCELILSELN